MKRREFIKLLGAATTAWPLAGEAQEPERVRRIGVLMNVPADDPKGQVRLAAFSHRLRELGWTDGGNLRIEHRWGAGNADLYRTSAAELIALSPDAILAATSPAVLALRQVSRIVPIVFVGVIDPVGSGLIASLPRPGGNATVLTIFEYAISAKWLELLREIAPRVTRAAVLRDAAIASGIGQFAAIQATAPIGMELSAIDARDTVGIELAIASFAREPNGGLIITAGDLTVNHPETIATFAGRYNVPAVYPFRFFADSGGLISYGPDVIDPYRRAATYVDRILRGEKPADLPVQAPTKYELVINLRTAKALGLEVPPTLLARADEVIE